MLPQLAEEGISEQATTRVLVNSLFLSKLNDWIDKKFHQKEKEREKKIT